jgi:hypothetical protein
VLAVRELLTLHLDRDGAVVEVNVLPSEPEQLTAAKPAERSCQHERPVARVDAIGELVDLAEGGQFPLGGVLGAGPADRARIGREDAVVDGGVQDGVEQAVALRHGARTGTALGQRGVPRPDRWRAELADRHPAQRREDVEPELALV